MSERTNKVTLHADGLSLLALPVGEVLAQARRHVADALQWAMPQEAEDPSHAVFWMVCDNDRMEVSLEVDEDWVSDVDCDGVEWYQQRRATVTVWAVEGLPDIVLGYWQTGVKAPSWVKGM